MSEGPIWTIRVPKLRNEAEFVPLTAEGPALVNNALQDADAVSTILFSKEPHRTLPLSEPFQRLFRARYPETQVFSAKESRESDKEESHSSAVL